jgi:hypothetical protein
MGWYHRVVVNPSRLFQGPGKEVEEGVSEVRAPSGV